MYKKNRNQQRFMITNDFYMLDSYNERVIKIYPDIYKIMIFQVIQLLEVVWLLIRLIDRSTPIVKKAYGLSRKQAAVEKEYIDEMLGKIFIHPSNSPYSAPVLIVKKPEGGLRVCVDYRALNTLIIKNRNIPPFIWETFARPKFTASLILSQLSMRYVYEKDTRKKRHFIQDIGCMNMLWCLLVYVMLQEHFSLISTRRFGNS